MHRPTGPKTKLANGRVVTNLASYNFYNLNANEQIKEKAIQTLRTYGVGPCGPPQFYGTQDVHMKTETDIATYLGTEACIVYAQAFSTISSVIPAFCKRGDVIVADKAVNYSIRKGLEVSRSNIQWYNHGDMEDLERVMQWVVKEQARKKLTRRFIVTEALFETTGDSIDLPKFVSFVSFFRWKEFCHTSFAWLTINVQQQIELKEKYKFRMMLDETWSFGVLGRTGRGLTEAQNVDASQVDMIIGSLAGPLCAGGGFCAGNTDVVEHQRLMAASYTFSAALPAMLAVAASETLNLLQSNPEILPQCRENIKSMRAQLDPRSDWVMCTSVPENPIMILIFKPEIVKSRRLSIEDQERLLQECVDEVCCFPQRDLTRTYLPNLIEDVKTKREISFIVPCKRSHDHPSKAPPGCREHRPQGRLVDDPAGTEGLRHVGPVQEGHREGGCYHPPRHYQGDDPEVKQQAGSSRRSIRK